MRPELGPEFLIATESEAASGAESVSIDGIDGVAVDPQSRYGLAAEALANLQCILLDRECDYKVLDNYKEVYCWDEMHGPWLYRLPDDFLACLAASDLDSTIRLAEQWLEACYSFQINNAPKNWAESTIKELVTLARRAIQQNKNMYWQVPSC